MNLQEVCHHKPFNTTIDQDYQHTRISFSSFNQLNKLIKGEIPFKLMDLIQKLSYKSKIW